jgi:outer membrane protein insertion porin family
MFARPSGTEYGSPVLVMRVFAVSLWLAALVFATTGCKDEGTIQVSKLTFKGVENVDDGRLKAALATHQGSKIPWGRKAYFDRARFDEDLKRIQAFYADRGFPDARVTSFDVKLNDKQDQVDITVTIAEGEPVRVAVLDFRGFEVIPPDHLAEMKKRVPLKVGDPRDRQLVVATHDLAVNELRDHGYPYGKVTTNEEIAAEKQATLSFAADPGKLAQFGPVEIVGNKSVGEEIIRRQLTFKPGELYRRSIVQDSQRRLYGMELFQFANIEPVNPEQQPEEVPIRVTIAEGNHQRFNVGVGYGTEEKARIDSEYRHVNFLGGARSAGVHGRYSALDRGIRADFKQPYFFAPHFSLGLEGQAWKTFTPAYQSVTRGVKLTATHHNNERTSWAVSVNSEHSSSAIDPVFAADPDFSDFIDELISLGFDPTTLEQNGVLNAIGFDFQHSTADNLLNAKRGYQLAFHAEEAGRLVPGSYNYYAASADARHYLPLGERVVVASRAQIGNIRPIGEDASNVPFSKKYLLGGATSIRGWGRFEVSPLSDGIPIGGNSMLAMSAELRANLFGKLGGVLFVDAGNVWADSLDYDLRDLRYAIGPGLRYLTPVGPIRFDVGFQLNPIPGLLVNGEEQKRALRFHFSIGQAF